MIIISDRKEMSLSQSYSNSDQYLLVMHFTHTD